MRGFLSSTRQFERNRRRFRYDRSDYFWNLDSDVLLLEPSVLQDLISNNLSVVAPLLTSLGILKLFYFKFTQSVVGAYYL